MVHVVGVWLMRSVCGPCGQCVVNAVGLWYVLHAVILRSSQSMSSCCGQFGCGFLVVDAFIVYVKLV